jgi:hypothetical protein
MRQSGVRGRGYDRAMRKAYVVLAGLLLLNVAFQFVTAGRFIFDGDSIDPHGAGAGAAHLWPLLMVIVSAVGKLGKPLIISAVVLLVLVVVQSGIPEGGAGFLHPLVAAIIAFGAYHALMLARGQAPTVETSAV